MAVGGLAPQVFSYDWDKCHSLFSDHFLLRENGQRVQVQGEVPGMETLRQGRDLWKRPHAGTQAVVTDRGALPSDGGRTWRLWGVPWFTERSSDRKKTSLILNLCHHPWSQKLPSPGRGALIFGLGRLSLSHGKMLPPEQRARPEWASQGLQDLNVASPGKTALIALQPLSRNCSKRSWKIKFKMKCC